MSRGARLLTFEPLLPEGLQSTVTDQLIVMADLEMLVAVGGRERTVEEYQALLEGVGLQFRRALPLPQGRDCRSSQASV